LLYISGLLSMARLGVIVVALCVFLGVLTAHGAIYTGSVVTNDNWHYWTKFCCSNQDPNDHECHMNFMVQSKNANLSLVVYIGYNGAPVNASSQRDGDWDDTYAHRPGTSSAWTCQRLYDNHKLGGERFIGAGASVNGTIAMSQYVRAYYWFVALADCTANTLNVPVYVVNWTNPGGFWTKNFSYDQQGLVVIYIFYTIFYFILVCVHGWAIYQQHQAEQWHPVIRVLSVAILLGFLSNLAEMIHYLIYAGNGVGVAFILGFGDLLAMVSQIVLMFQCILIAKGWAITTSYLTDKYIVLAVMALFVVAYLALFIWDKAAPNPASVLYFYESVPGIIVAILRVLTCGWFIWSLRNTIRLESLPEKRMFYFIFGGSYTVWFLLLPLIVLIAVFLAPWVRFRIITALMVTSDFVGLSALAFLLWPSRASNYFVIKASPQLLSVKGGGGTGYGTTAYDATNAL